MTGDDFRKDLVEERAFRLRNARIAAGFKFASTAATQNRWNQSTYRSHENGTRPIDAEDAERYARGFSKTGPKVAGIEIMYGPRDDHTEAPAHPNSVPVMGLIGAGALIDPGFEQTPPDGIYQIQLPFPVPDGLIAFQVDGESMMPYYDDGDVVVVWKEQRRNLESFFGELAAVMTSDGNRYLKKIQPGRSRSVVNLHSFNAKPIENVKLVWIGEVCMWTKKSQVHRVTGRRRDSPRDAPAGRAGVR